MSGYSEECREAVRRKMLLPNNRPLKKLAAEECSSEGMLYNRRRRACEQGRLLPDADAGPAGWSAADKVAAVLENAALNEAELAEYCRKRGLGCSSSYTGITPGTATCGRKNHLYGVLNAFDSRLSNGRVEGINSLIQAAKARARGYAPPLH